MKDVIFNFRIDGEEILNLKTNSLLLTLLENVTGAVYDEDDIDNIWEVDYNTLQDIIKLSGHCIHKNNM